MNDSINDLRKIAQDATAGPWIAEEDTGVWSVSGGPNNGLVAQIGNHAYPCAFDEANAKFIAAFNPEMALKLLAELETLYSHLIELWLDKHMERPI